MPFRSSEYEKKFPQWVKDALDGKTKMTRLNPGDKLVIKPASELTDEQLFKVMGVPFEVAHKEITDWGAPVESPGCCEENCEEHRHINEAVLEAHRRGLNTEQLMSEMEGK